MKVIKEGRRRHHVKVHDTLVKPPESDDFTFAGSGPCKRSQYCPIFQIHTRFGLGQGCQEGESLNPETSYETTPKWHSFFFDQTGRFSGQRRRSCETTFQKLELVLSWATLHYVGWVEPTPGFVGFRCTQPNRHFAGVIAKCETQQRPISEPCPKSFYFD
jgi:hypothetical protein